MSWLQDNQKDITGIGIILILSIAMASARKKRGRKANQKAQNTNPRLTIPVKSAEQLNHLFAAESHLSKAGVRFDTGSSIKNRKPVTRDWELDYSLSGAKIKNPILPPAKCRDCGKEYWTLKGAHNHVIKTRHRVDHPQFGPYLKELISPPPPGVANPRSPGLPRGAKGRCPGCGKPVYRGGLFHYHRYWHERCFRNRNPRPELTSISRRGLPAPVKAAMQFISGRVLDYGCGREKTVETYLPNCNVVSYDKYWHPAKPKGQFDTIISSYVLNVIPLNERHGVLKDMHRLLKFRSILIIAVRSKTEILREVTKKWKPYQDGFITPKNTFQKGFTKTELIDLVAGHGFKFNQQVNGAYIFAK